MALAQLSIDLVARLASFERDMGVAAKIASKNSDSIVASITKVKNVVQTVIGGAAVTGLVAMVRAQIDAIDKFNDLKDATGASIENISALDNLARRTGVSFDTIGAGLVKFNAALKEGGDPNKGSGSVFKALGLDVEKLKQMDPAEALRVTAVAFGQFAEDGNRARAMQELFGKSTREVAAFIKDLGEAGKLNATVVTKQAEETEKFNKELFRMSANAEDAKRAIAMELVPALNNLFDKFKDNGGGASGFFSLFGFDKKFFSSKELSDKSVELQTLNKAILQRENDLAKGIGFFGKPEDIERQLANLRPMFEKAKKEFRDLHQATRGYSLNSTAGAGRGSVNPDFVKPTLTVAQPEDKAAENAFAGLLKRIQERIDATKQEIAVGRQLTDEEKFQIKTEADFQELQRRYPGLSKAKVAGMLAESAALSQQVDIRKADLNNAAIYAKAWAKEEEELAAFDKSRADERDRVLAGLREQKTSLEDSGAMLAKERQLIGATAEQRELALGSLRVELSLQRELQKIDEDRLLTEEARALAKTNARSNAEEEKRQIKERIDMGRDGELAEDVRGAISSGLMAGFKDGKNPAIVFAETLANAVYSRLSKRVADALTDTVLGGGGINGGGALGDLAASFGYRSPNAAGGVNSAGFGSGAGYGNQDLGANFAMGGVMTSRGSVPLRAYAGGGVANSPQMAIFGEGSMAEAYVPLPDGRRIPVAMQGGGGGRPIVQHFNMTVGDVASVSVVRDQIRAANSQLLAGLDRAQRYGGRG